MSQKKSTNLPRIRRIILIGLGVLVLVVLGYGTLYSTGVTQGEFVAREHYRILENFERRRPGESIEVLEFFSYACIHCRNFDPLVNAWQESLPEGVTFSRSPVAFDAFQALLARTYLTLDYLDILDANQERIFSQIHDRQIQFRSPEQIAGFIDGHGASSEEFLRAFNSPQVRGALRETEIAQRDLEIRTIPTLIVAGKYLVDMGHGRKVALEITDYLIELEMSGEANAAAE